MNPDSIEFNELGHRPQLDGVRGVAILGVLFVHTNHIFGWSVVSGGNLGVDVFFVLSGFLITSILLRELHEKGNISFKRFYARRVLRLVPALTAMLLVVMISAPVFYSPDEIIKTWRAVPLAFLYLTDFAIAFFDTPLGVFRHTWSLSIEEQFYLVWPAMLLALTIAFEDRRKRLWSIALLSIAFAIYRAVIWWYSGSISRTYYSVDTRADSLLVGCVAGMLFSWKIVENHNLKRFLKILSFPAILVLGVGYVWTDYATPFLYEWGFFIVAVSAAILILSIVSTENSVIARALSGRAIVWIGGISYGVYLWHYPIFKAVHYVEAAWYVQLLIALVLTFGISYLSFRLVEKPFLKLKKRFF